MLFSILVPVYNVEKYFRECLDSVFGQTFKDFELILINDGSTDSSGSICDMYKMQHPDGILVLHQENAGLLTARRTAISYARGEYCVFLDSDDTLELNCLQKVADMINENPKTDMVIYNLNRWYEDTGKIVKNAPVFDNNCVFENSKEALYLKLISSYDLNNLVIKSIKTELLKNDDTDYSQFSHSSYSEDLLQTLYPLTYAKKIVYSDAGLYNYRINSSSMISNLNYDVLDKRFNRRVWQQIQKYMKIWEMDTPQYMEMLYANNLKHLINNFTVYFHAAKTWAQKKQCISVDWFSLLLPETSNYKGSKYLRINIRFRLYLIYHKCIIALYIVDLIQSTKKALSGR